MKKLFLLLLLIPSILHAQQDSSALFLKVKSNTFLRDAEFFMPFTKGYTASGFRLTPTLQYRVNEKVNIEGGVMLTGVAGTEGLWKTQPVLSINYWPCSWFGMTMGTLWGSTDHFMGEPLYDAERWFYDFKEDGLQLMVNSKHFISDTWLNWENFLEAWTPDQERFTLGSHNRILFGIEDIEIAIPLQFMGSHRGGQFTTLDTCIETLFNEGIGLDINMNHWRIMALGYFFQNMSPTPKTAFNDGWAFYPQLRYQTEKFNLTLGYWMGHQYQSARGSYLFQSVSWHDPSFSQPERHMITLRGEFLHRENKNFSLDLEAEVYHDLDLSQTDFLFGLRLNFAKKWKLL